MRARGLAAEKGVAVAVADTGPDPQRADLRGVRSRVEVTEQDHGLLPGDRVGVKAGQRTTG